jgi:selenocysteine lyase/cysteine desulfurase
MTIFRLLDAKNDNPGTFFRETTPQMFMTAIDAAAKFLGADPKNLVFVQNTTTDKRLI